MRIQEDFMRAWMIEQPGEADVMKLGKIDQPRPGPEEVRIEVHAIGINRADIVQRRGFYPPPPGFDARIPGLEYAGVVAEAGDMVQGLAAYRKRTRLISSNVAH